MRRPHLLPPQISHPNVTPLIDVVMCLVVFFMLVARIGINTGADHTMKLPASFQGVDIKDMGNTLTLNVRPGPGGQPMVRSRVRDKDEYLPLFDPQTQQKTLAQTLSYFRYGPDKTKPETANPDFKVIIRAEEDLSYRFLEPVLTACAEAGVKSVNFNTVKVSGN